MKATTSKKATAKNKKAVEATLAPEVVAEPTVELTVPTVTTQPEPDSKALIVAASKPKFEMRNGEHRMRDGTVGDRLFAVYDSFLETNGRAPTVKEAVAHAEAAGLNTTSASKGYYSWRKYNDLQPAKFVAAVEITIGQDSGLTSSAH